MKKVNNKPQQEQFIIVADVHTYQINLKKDIYFLGIEDDYGKDLTLQFDVTQIEGIAAYLKKRKAEDTPEPATLDGFTPGEWEVVTFDGNLCIASDWEGDITRGEPTMVCQINKAMRFNEDELKKEAEANAALIAAAPRLYRENQELKQKLNNEETKRISALVDLDEVVEQKENLMYIIEELRKQNRVLLEALTEAKKIIERMSEEFSTVAHRHASYTNGEAKRIEAAIRSATK